MLLDKGVQELGATDDVRPLIAAADCVVLPSYREGSPRTLLEAAAMRRPVITADSVGCRDVVDDGTTGLICRSRDAQDVSDKMMQMFCLGKEHRARMGRQGRAKMELEYDEQIVIERLQAINLLVASGARAYRET